MTLSHNDDPVLQDGFDNQCFIMDICSLIQRCKPPKGIGLNGYWGTGKTSALLQIYYQLSGKSPYGDKLVGLPAPTDPSINKMIMPIWFEAWRYQHEERPIVALLNEIRLQMGLWAKFQNKAEKMTGVALLGVISAFDEVIKVASGGVIKPELGKLQSIGNAWEAERFQQPLSGQAIRSLLQEAIKKALTSRGHTKLAIFIDDLDRCEPEAALRLMEGIKVYLNLNNCVVIFGMDQRQVERALIKALGLNNEGKTAGSADHYAREYLEKICQDIIHLPLADKAKKSAYLKILLQQIVTDENQKSYINKINEVTEAYDCLPANPRKIKALANRIASILRQMAHSDWDDKYFDSSLTLLTKAAALCLIMAIFYCFHRSVYEQLQKNPGYIQDVIGFAQESNTTDNRYSPMSGILASRDAKGELPVNPSDSNVFRLHQLLMDLQSITVDEIQPFSKL
jgi:hypothetical protein